MENLNDCDGGRGISIRVRVAGRQVSYDFDSRIPQNESKRAEVSQNQRMKSKERWPCLDPQSYLPGCADKDSALVLFGEHSLETWISPFIVSERRRQSVAPASARSSRQQHRSSQIELEAGRIEDGETRKIYSEIEGGHTLEIRRDA